jgi:hypothetical protein
MQGMIIVRFALYCKGYGENKTRRACSRAGCGFSGQGEAGRCYSICSCLRNKYAG